MYFINVRNFINKINIKYLFFIIILSRNTFAFITKNNKNLFMSLKSSEVNLRAGPNKNFITLYTYKLRYMPVKVIGEYDKWFNIIDKDGDSGWVIENLVSRVRTVITLQDIQFLYSNYSDIAIPIYRVEKNVILHLIKCKKSRCKVKIGKIKGWLNKSDIWGFDE